jgi:hypothetical protein
MDNKSISSPMNRRLPYLPRLILAYVGVAILGGVMFFVVATALTFPYAALLFVAGAATGLITPKIVGKVAARMRVLRDVFSDRATAS